VHPTNQQMNKSTPQQLNISTSQRSTYCGVMKPKADMPPCLGGGEHRINTA